MATVSVLFVCLGNICRSPLAEGTFSYLCARESLVARVDSAGLGDWHLGSLPDTRSISVAARHGIDLTNQKARKIERDDFYTFDLILGMDERNVERLHNFTPDDGTARIALFLDYALGLSKDVPDPYSEPDSAFDQVFDMVYEANEALVRNLSD